MQSIVPSLIPSLIASTSSLVLNGGFTFVHLPTNEITDWGDTVLKDHTYLLDLNLSHDFLLSKGKKESKVLSLSLNSFNVLNHPNYVTYIGTISSPLFGKPVAAQPPRRMQLDVEFKF